MTLNHFACEAGVAYGRHIVHFPCVGYVNDLMAWRESAILSTYQKHDMWDIYLFITAILSIYFHLYLCMEIIQATNYESYKHELTDFYIVIRASQGPFLF